MKKKSLVKKAVLVLAILIILAFVCKKVVCYIHDYEDTTKRLEASFEMKLEDYDVQEIKNTMRWNAYGGMVEVSLRMDEAEKDAFVEKVIGLGFVDITECVERDCELYLEKDNLPERNIWSAKLGLIKSGIDCLPSATVMVREQEEGYLLTLNYYD